MSAKKLVNYKNLPVHEGPLYSYRIYHIKEPKIGEYVLYGMYGVPWPSNTLEAICSCGKCKWLIEDCLYNTSKGWDYLLYPHNCGIYSYKDINSTNYAINEKTLFAVAQCIIYGIVVPHEKGYRSQFAKIESINIVKGKYWDSRFNSTKWFNIETLIYKLESRYKVPVNTTFEESKGDIDVRMAVEF